MVRKILSKAIRIGGFYTVAALLAFSAFSTVWSPSVHANGSSFSGAGAGTPSDPYLVTTCQHFQDINNNEDGYDGFGKSYKLMADLDCSGLGNAIIAAGYFSGSFDGNNHSITIALNSSDTYIGLFSNLEGGTISDLTVSGSVTASTANSEVGMLAGTIQIGSTVSGVTVNADVEAPNGSYDVGGMAGLNNGGTVSDSVVTGSVSSAGSNVGGFIGNSICMAHLSDSHSTASVTGGGDRVGGFVGSDGCEGPGTTYENVYATGSVTSTGSEVGGLVGWAPASTITDSYATGNVSGAMSVGGLVGHAEYGTSISRSYASGSVSGSNEIGGLAGLIESSSSVSQSFATGNVTGTADHAGGLVGFMNGGASVSNSYARGTVGGADNSGGAIGYINSGSVHNIYSTGAVNGGPSHQQGGLVAHDGSGNSGDGLFWDTQTSGLSTSSLGTGKTTAQMKTRATYTSLSTPGLGSTAWDFKGNFGADDGTDEIWNFSTGLNNGYPCLTWYSTCMSGTGGEPSDDADGISAGIEAGAPNNGDGNNDGVADNTQDNVSSFVNSVTGHYVTIEAPNACSLSSVSAAAAAANSDGSYSYPNGLVRFNADCGTPGYTAVVKVFTYGTSDDYSLRKYNSVTHTYGVVPGAAISHQTIGGQAVTVATYSITDGGALDEDATANGVIVDPVGLAVTGSGAVVGSDGAAGGASAAAAGASGSGTAASGGALADTGQQMLLAALTAALVTAIAVIAHRKLSTSSRKA